MHQNGFHTHPILARTTSCIFGSICSSLTHSGFGYHCGFSTRPMELLGVLSPQHHLRWRRRPSEVPKKYMMICKYPPITSPTPTVQMMNSLHTSHDGRHSHNLALMRWPLTGPLYLIPAFFALPFFFPPVTLFERQYANTVGDSSPTVSL